MLNRVRPQPIARPLIGRPRGWGFILAALVFLTGSSAFAQRGGAGCAGMAGMSGGSTGAASFGAFGGPGLAGGFGGMQIGTGGFGSAGLAGGPGLAGGFGGMQIGTGGFGSAGLAGGPGLAGGFGGVQNGIANPVQMMIATQQVQGMHGHFSVVPTFGWYDSEYDHRAELAARKAFLKEQAAERRQRLAARQEKQSKRVSSRTATSSTK